ncbi:Aspartate aminotransferase, cytoplasmic [Rhizophlyctis rosea]|uniref:aspartate transaminase n=1 Tax=Rhizophlyctis rosea TaxID=64517 RepID=A0AAD5X6D4_9FUNG|nr:Aspartate aminotransferase, cytoplasmic [Rhizophlyctis rosea]
MTVTYDNSLQNVPLAPPDAILNLSALYKADTDPHKINLGVGAYRDNDGKPWILPVVKKAEELILHDPNVDHEYLPTAGLQSFTDASAKLIFGADSPAIKEKRVGTFQTISGTGACRIAADFLARHRKAPIYISNPSWANHQAIFTDAGLEIKYYQYWDPQTRGLAFASLIETFKSAPEGSIILLHPCAHNPTGVDPTFEQWKIIADVLKSKNHFPFFDCAYQGFASGDLDRDAQAVRYFVEQGFEMLVTQSFAKNMGLYGERCGALNVVAKTEESAKKAVSQWCKISRAAYSTAPSYGARIASTVLNNPELYQQWTEELKTMSYRIINMRDELFKHLQELGTPGTWNHVVDQIGMFSYTGLNLNQVNTLKEKFHVYLTDNGRISMAGLNTGNVRKFAEAVDWVVRNVQ